MDRCTASPHDVAGISRQIDESSHASHPTPGRNAAEEVSEVLTR